MSLPFKPHSSLLIAGATGSGKSWFTKRLIENIPIMFANDPPVKVIYCYSTWQRLFDDMETTLSFISFHKGLPGPEHYEYQDNHTLFIFDDLMSQVVDSPRVRDMFTQGTHHNNITLVFITQNLYQQGKWARTIALNTWYMILFRNFRDSSQIKVLAKQTGLGAKLVHAYKDATSHPYGYIVLDFSPNIEDKYRLRSRIFPGEDTWVYV